LEDDPPRTFRAVAHTQALAKLGLLDEPIFEGYDMTEL
jgi:hypothetical protein